MDLLGKDNIFNSKTAILLAAFSYQTYPYFLNGTADLTKRL